MDSGTRPRQGHSLRRQLHRLAVAEAEAARAGRPRGRSPPAHAGAREGMDRGLAESAPGQVQGALPALRGPAGAGQRKADPDRADHDSGGRAPGPERGRFEGLTKGFGGRLLIDNLTFKLPPGGIVGVIGPNGAGKTTLFRMITGQEKPDNG